MRALVIGASGQVGAALLRVLRARGHEAVGTWAHEAFPGLVPLDFTDPAATERLVVETRPDWMLCPAALCHVDYCEEHPDEAFATNRDGPLAAAKAAARAGAGFVFYSSDYVFDGVDGPYAEDARRARSACTGRASGRPSRRCWARSRARWWCAPAWCTARSARRRTPPTS